MAASVCANCKTCSRFVILAYPLWRQTRRQGGLAAAAASHPQGFLPALLPVPACFSRAQASPGAERPAGKLYFFPGAAFAGAPTNPSSPLSAAVAERNTSFVKKNFPSLGTSMI